MKYLVSYFTFIALFLAPAFAYAAGTTTPFDLNGNGILDSDEAEVIVEADAVLPAGEYHFNNLTITNNATLTAEGNPESSNAFKGVKITADSLTIETGASLRADGTGYGSGFGPGAPTVWYAGASYGGVGIGNLSTSTYGSATKPTDLGSGNGSCGSLCGGGALRLIVSGILANNGTISANGGGSSSGGSLYITASTLTGNGTFSANGGDNTWVGCCLSSAGGGGRIAIYYQNKTFTGTTTALGGTSHGAYYFDPKSYAENGTVGFFDTTNNTLTIDSLWRFQANDSPLNFNKIILKNSSKSTAETGASITANELLVDENSLLTLSGEETMTLEKLTITGNSSVTVAHEKTLSLTIPNFIITPGSSLNTDGKGYKSGFGPGAPANPYYGASYGGVGIANTPESTYGSATAPTDFGSGSGACTSPSLCGGGALRLIVTDTLANDGIISSNGGGSSSGGSVYVTANNITGSGIFSADGGNGTWLSCCYAGAGGGGRVAVYYQNSTFTGTSTALGGLSQSAYYNPASYAGNGTVVFEEEGTPEPPAAECCSSVAFLPGLEASRLYRDLPLAGETRLWEPPIIHNNSQLFLNPDGTPQVVGIYTKEVIDEVFTIEIYESFIDSINTLVSDGTIAEWKPLPYDWRFDIDDIVENPITLATTSYSMIDEVVRLASSSPTKKVTIVAHSNGGLVGKELISKLEELGKGNIVDKFIMVAVPQLGTPKALTTMLHGEGLPISFPVLLSKESSRILAENMPSAYNLLPSAEYFDRVIDPVATFNPDDPLAENYFAQYGFHVSNYAEFRGFLLGADGRDKPSTDDLFTPNNLNDTLLSQAELNHTTLDVWTSPANVEVVQIAGWGLDTIKGIKYKQRIVCGGFLCSTKLDPEPEMTIDGDKTVVTPSASAFATTTYWANLKNLKKGHQNILESITLQNFLKNIIQNSTNLLPGITTIKPTSSPNDKASLRLKVFSPVSLDLYDPLGNHTGISTTTLLGDVALIEEQISNSYYLELGEGKYAGAEKSGTTIVELLGQDFGTFTFVAEEVQADHVTASTTFIGIPVTASTTAVFNLSETADIASTTIAMDIDGDGATDTTLTPGDGITEEELVSILKGIVKTLNLPDDNERKILKNLEKLEKELIKERNGLNQEKVKTSKAFEDLIIQIKKFEKKKLFTAGEAAELISVIEQIRREVIE